MKFLSHKASSFITLLGLTKDVFGDTPHNNIQEDLSFGAHGQVWTDDHRSITGFNLGGENGYHPELLSDRIIMTPPWPGNKRASLWADHPEPNDDWIVQLNFRATGPEYASGNMNVWYVKNKDEVGTSSIYTVGKFDGLAIIIDQYGGQGGSIRGFLNDGSKSYKDHHHVDSLPFGHCDFAYRNTGHFLNLELRQNPKEFEVVIEGKSCFKTHKVQIPKNYFLGLTAASAENADSFEVKSFVVRFPGDEPTPPPGQRDQYNGHSHGEGKPLPPPTGHDQYRDRGWHWTDEKSQIKDSDSAKFKNEQERFSDLHDRIQLLNHQLDIMFHDISMFKDQQEERHKELIHWLAPIHDFSSQTKYLLEDLQKTIVDIDKNTAFKEFREQIDGIRHLIGESHLSLAQHIPATFQAAAQLHGPRFGFFVFLVFAFQVMLLGSYIIYRRRREMQPKKYL